MNSREKGKRGELELAAVLRDYGYDTRRGLQWCGPQFCGANGYADVEGLPGIHIECKRVERLDLDKAMSQAIGDARDGEVPAVFHRKNNGNWRVTLGLDDFMKMYKAWEAEKCGLA